MYLKKQLIQTNVGTYVPTHNVLFTPCKVIYLLVNIFYSPFDDIYYRDFIIYYYFYLVESFQEIG